MTRPTPGPSAAAHHDVPFGEGDDPIQYAIAVLVAAAHEAELAHRDALARSHLARAFGLAGDDSR